MGLTTELIKCNLKRTREVPDVYGKITQGSNVNFNVLKQDKSSCEVELEITKNIPRLLDIELVYLATCEKEEDCKKDCDINKRIKSVISLEANLLVSNILNAMGFPPFPMLLGDLNDEKGTASSKKD